MKEFYEPILYMSTPEHPNTMEIQIELKEPVDGGILQSVVEELRVRFPYFYIKVTAKDNDLCTIPNPLPMTVRNTWDPIDLNSEASNFHLGAWKFDKKRLAFEISHTLTDGAGVIPYIKSTLYLYLSKKTGTAFDPEGFRLPGDDIPESETGNPFAGLDIDSAEEPLYLKPPIEDFYRLNPGEDHDPAITYIKLSESQLMQYCRDFDGSPNAFITVLLARAIRRYDPESEKPISIAVAVDHKAMLGNHDNYRLFANVVVADFPKNRSLSDLTKTCTMVRGQIMLQAQPENSLWAMKQKKALYAKLDPAPLDVKLNVISKAAGSPRWSVSVSYVSCRSLGPLDPFIDAMYAVVEPGVTDVACEITCLNHQFFLSIGQTYSSEDFIRVFLDELASVGIDYDIIRKEPLHLCGLEKFSQTREESNSDEKTL